MTRKLVANQVQVKFQSVPGSRNSPNGNNNNNDDDNDNVVECRAESEKKNASMNLFSFTSFFTASYPDDLFSYHRLQMCLH